MEYSCLFVQKDTLEKEKVKAILRSFQSNPEEYLTQLQESHCIPYQLIAFCATNPELINRLNILVKPFKTNYGKDWYEFNHNALADIISLYIEYDSIYLNVCSIADIMGFTFKMYPVVKKEIKVSTIAPSRIHEVSIIGPDLNIPLKIDAVPLKDKEEILEKIAELEKSDRSERKHERKEVPKEKRPRNRSDKHHERSERPHDRSEKRPDRPERIEKHKEEENRERRKDRK